MAGALSISAFLILITGGLFSLGIGYTFSRMEIINLLLKRSCIVLGITMLMFTSTVMATIAASSGIALTSEMFMFIEVFGWAMYCAMMYFVLQTLFDILRLKKQARNNEVYNTEM